MFSRSIAIVEASASHAAWGLFRPGSDGRLRLEQHAVESFVLEPDREGEWLKKIAAALQSLRVRVNRPGPVVLTLPAHVMLAKFLKTPRVDAAKRAKIIRFEAQQNIPYALTDVVWAGTLVGETAAGGDVMLCAAKLDVVEPLCAAAEAAGFFPRCLLPCALGTLAAGRHPAAAVPPRTLVANLGARSTTLLLVEKDRAHLRSFSLGGNSVTQHVAQARNYDFAAAEECKLSGQERQLLEPAVSALAARLAQEITRSMLHFQQQSAVEAPLRLLLTGGCARLPDLPGLLAKRLNLPVGRFAPGEAVEAGCLTDSGGVKDDALALTDLIGAAALQLTNGQPTVNLLPSRFRTREIRRRRQPWLAIAAALGVASLAPPIINLRSLVAVTHHQSAAAERELALWRTRSARNRGNLKNLEEVLRRIAVLQDVQDRRATWINLLADLQGRLVSVGDVWLERLRIVPATGPGGPPPGPPAPLRIAVSGRMLDQANPLSKVSDDTYRRVKGLLASFASSPFVAKVEGEVFDNTQPGVLRFNFVLVTDAAHPL